MKPNKRSFAFLSLILLGSLHWACSPAQTPLRSTNSTVVANDALSGYAAVFRSKTIDGNIMEIDDRATLLVVFASWCGHCQKELKELAILHKKFPHLRIVGLNAYEDYNNLSDENRLREYLQSEAPWLEEIVVADSQMLARFGGVPKIPSMFIYRAPQELVAEFKRGKQAKPKVADIEEAIQRALR